VGHLFFPGDSLFPLSRRSSHNSLESVFFILENSPPLPANPPLSRFLRVLVMSFPVSQPRLSSAFSQHHLLLAFLPPEDPQFPFFKCRPLHRSAVMDPLRLSDQSFRSPFLRKVVENEVWFFFFPYADFPFFSPGRPAVADALGLFPFLSRPHIHLSLCSRVQGSSFFVCRVSCVFGISFVFFLGQTFFSVNFPPLPFHFPPVDSFPFSSRSS